MRVNAGMENPDKPPQSITADINTRPYYKRVVKGLADGVMSSELGCVAILFVIAAGIVVIPVVLVVALLFDLFMLPLRHRKKRSDASSQIAREPTTNE